MNSYKDYEVITDNVAKKVKDKFGIDLTFSDIWLIISTAVFEYGYKCILAGQSFRLWRFGTWKVKTYSKAAGGSYVADMKKKKLERAKKNGSAVENNLDNVELNGRFALLNDCMVQATIINNNGNENGTWSGNYGKFEFRPDAEAVG